MLVTVKLKPDDRTKNEINYEVNAVACHGYKNIETKLVKDTSMFAITQGVPVDDHSLILVKLENEYTKEYVPVELILNVYLHNLPNY